MAAILRTTFLNEWALLNKIIFISFKIPKSPIKNMPGLV